MNDVVIPKLYCKLIKLSKKLAISTAMYSFKILTQINVLFIYILSKNLFSLASKFKIDNSLMVTSH